MTDLTARLELNHIKITGVIIILSVLSGLTLVIAPVISILGTIFFVVAIASFLRPKWGLFCSLVFSFIMPPFPEASDSFPLFHIAFAVLALCVIAGWLCRLSMGKARLRRSDIFCPASLTLLFFLVMSLANFLVALANDVEIYEWLRGVAPFLTLAYYFVFLTELRYERDINKVIRLIKVGVIWFALESIFIYIREQNRVTLYDFRLIFPYTVIGGIVYFSLMLNRIHNRRGILYGFLWMLFVIATLLTLTRGLIFGLVIGCVFLLLKKTSLSFILRRYLLVKLLVALMLIVLIASLISGLRYEDLAISFMQWVENPLTIEARAIEARTSYNEIITSPILGKGFGFSYVTPFDLAYETDRMRYVHNYLIYFLLTSGLPGAILYTCLYVFSYKGLSSGPDRSDAISDELRPNTIQAILIGLLFYCLTSATFRTFQYNVFLGFFLYLAFVLRGSEPHVRHT